jgi:hypothetical protein
MARLWLVGVVARSLSFPMMRSLMRSFRLPVPSTEMAPCGVSGRLDNLCLVGRWRSLIAYFADS